MVALREKEVANEREPEVFSVSLIVFDKKREKVLLVRHTKERKEGMVGFPGGKPLSGSTETLLEAGIRELREETGLKTTSDSLISYPDNIYLGHIARENNDVYYAYKAYICLNFEGVQKKKSEEGKPFWATISKLDRYGARLAPSVKTAVSESLNFLNNQSQ
jgi:8-oxo-dGTP pyrophosphatase MutT (NUDIX family)